MNVQELIDHLMQVDDKTRVVVCESTGREVVDVEDPIDEGDDDDTIQLRFSAADGV